MPENQSLKALPNNDSTPPDDRPLWSSGMALSVTYGGQ
jgi:hypothetical protein